ncbi:MAG: lipopolysaccharide assembly protein LapA domain-containing protein [Dissulfurispiraceae bacterium]
MLIAVFVLTLIALVTIFSVQNATPVSVTFFFWKFDASLAIVLFLAVLSGAVISALIFYSQKVKKSLKSQNKPSVKP